MASWEDLPDKKDSWEDLPDLPPVKGKGHVASAMLNSSGADDLVRGAGHLAEGVAKEASDPAFALRTNLVTAPATGLYKLATDPKGEVEGLASAANGATLGGLSKGAQALSSKPEAVSDYFRKAAEDKPVEGLAGGALLPGGGEIAGIKGVLARPAIQGSYGALGAYFNGRDPKAGFASGLAGGAGAEALSAPLRASGPLAKSAELNAWKATQGVPGISDVAAKMGYDTEQDIRGAGRSFLDRGLIPVGGRAADIADRARGLKRVAGNAADSLYGKAEVSKRDFDYLQHMGAADKSLRTPALSGTGEKATGPTEKFLDSIAVQEGKTPGSYLGARRNLSDAQDAINLDEAAPLEARLHRKALMGARGDLTSQVGAATSPKDAAALAGANKDLSVAYDAEQLANRGARRQAGHQLNLGTLLSRAGIGGMAGEAMGHGGAGGTMGAVSALAEYLTKHRQASALARGEDLASRLGSSPVGVGLSGVGRVLPAAERSSEDDPWEYFRK